MKTTTLGKLLVFAMLVASLTMATMALGVATHQIKWADTEAPEKTEGLHSLKRAEIESLQENTFRFRGRWKATQNTLLALEKKRPEEQKWYADQLVGLVSKDKALLVRNTAYENDGRLRVDAQGRPVLVDHPDKRFENLETLQEKLTQLEKDITETILATQALIKELSQLTTQLRGDPGKVKGLNQLLDEAKLAQENAKKELESAKQDATNGRVASESLLKRTRELDRRIAELKNHLRAIAEANQ